jgi:putative hydrolase of the HAD superfamily
MKKKAIILDLDNTIFSVYSIGDTLFEPLFELIEQDDSQTKNLNRIRDEVMRRPFQRIAEDYRFSESLTKKKYCAVTTAGIYGAHSTIR